MTLSREETARYQRHLSLSQVGPEGQARLKAARVLLVGVGGLGSPIALYLAAAGVGHIGLVDGDTVELSNLQRQVLFTTDDVGLPKASRGAERLRALNPHLEVRAFDVRLTAENAVEISAGYDLLVDGTDSFSSRYLVNDLAVLTHRPLVAGAIFQFDGHLSVYSTPGGPCYRCVHPEPPPAALAPNCAEAGVLGVLPGLVGTLQATEVLKLILGHKSLAGRLLMVDALSMRFTRMTIDRDPNCALCGPNPTLTTLCDLPEICASASPWDLSLDDVARRASTSYHLLDVRTASEAEVDSLGAQLIPLDQLAGRLEEVPKDTTVIVHCQMGGRSAQAVDQLRAHGFTDVWNLAGGLAALRKAQASGRFERLFGCLNRGEGGAGVG